MVFGATLFGSHERHLFLLVWQPLVGFRLPCATPGNEAELRIYGGWVRTLVPFWPVCGPMFTKFSDNVGDPSYYPTSLSCFLCHVSFRRYSPLSLEVFEKPNKCKSVWSPIFWEGRPRLLYGRLLARFTVHRCAKFDNPRLSYSFNDKTIECAECICDLGVVVRVVASNAMSMVISQKPKPLVSV